LWLEPAFSESNALTVKVWAKKLFVEALKQTILDKFIGTGADSAIVVKDELSKMAGDRIRYGLRMQLAGDWCAAATLPLRVTKRR
jgi:hypothetical protein